jgi:DNA-binding NarL/FixJ family response regulator
VGTVNVVVVDDHPVFRHGIAALIESLDQLQLVGVTDSIEGLDQLELDDVDVVVLDLVLPGISGQDAVEVVAQSGPRVLAMAINGRSRAVVAAFGAGAHGYVTKRTDLTELVRAIETVAGGEIYVPADLATALLGLSRGDAPPELALTSRQREVLELLAAGLPDKQIARQLSISESTVRGHLEEIRNRTGSRRRAELTSYAISLRTDWVTEEPV